MFAVFGVCKAHCRAAARKSVKTFVKDEHGGRVMLSPDEWEAKVREAVDAMMQPGKTRQKQISIVYASRREAAEFADLAKKASEAVDVVIRCREAAKTTGGVAMVNAKTKKPVLRWADC